MRSPSPRHRWQGSGGSTISVDATAPVPATPPPPVAIDARPPSTATARQHGDRVPLRTVAHLDLGYRENSGAVIDGMLSIRARLRRPGLHDQRRARPRSWHAETADEMAVHARVGRQGCASSRVRRPGTRHRRARSAVKPSNGRRTRTRLCRHAREAPPHLSSLLPDRQTSGRSSASKAIPRGPVQRDGALESDRKLHVEPFLRNEES